MTTREVTKPTYAVSCDFCDTAAVAGSVVPGTWMKITFERIGGSVKFDMCPRCRNAVAEKLFSPAQRVNFAHEIATLLDDDDD